MKLGGLRAKVKSLVVFRVLSKQFTFSCREVVANEITELSLTRWIFVYPSKPSRKASKTNSASGQNNEKYNVCMTWDGLSTLARAWSSDDQDKVGQPKIPNFSLQLTGSEGSSDIEAISFGKAQSKNKGRSETKSEVRETEDL